MDKMIETVDPVVDVPVSVEQMPAMDMASKTMPTIKHHGDFCHHVNSAYDKMLGVSNILIGATCGVELVKKTVKGVKWCVKKVREAKVDRLEKKAEKEAAKIERNKKAISGEGTVK